MGNMADKVTSVRFLEASDEVFSLAPKKMQLSWKKEGARHLKCLFKLCYKHEVHIRKRSETEKSGIILINISLRVPFMKTTITKSNTAIRTIRL